MNGVDSTSAHEKMKTMHLVMCALAVMLFASCGTTSQSAVGTLAGSKVAARSAPSAKQTNETVVRKGMSYAQVKSIMGHPTTTSNNNGVITYYYAGTDVPGPAFNYPGKGFVVLAKGIGDGITRTMTIITFSGGVVSNINQNTTSPSKLFGALTEPIGNWPSDPTPRTRWEHVALST